MIFESILGLRSTPGISTPHFRTILGPKSHLGRILAPFWGPCGGLLEVILGPFACFFSVFFWTPPGVAPGARFCNFGLHFGSHSGVIFVDVWRALDLLIFATPSMRKLCFRGSGESLFGTFSESFLESVSGPSF